MCLGKIRFSPEFLINLLIISLINKIMTVADIFVLVRCIFQVKQKGGIISIPLFSGLSLRFLS